MRLGIKLLILAAAIAIYCLSGIFWPPPARAAGWDYFAAKVKPSGKCHGMREVAASFYSSGSHTANGERFNPSGYTAAHRTLPFGTMVMVKNPRNGKTIMVRINDRGPFAAAHRVGVKFDLSRGAAQAIGMRSSQYICVS